MMVKQGRNASKKCHQHKSGQLFNKKMHIEGVTFRKYQSNSLIDMFGGDLSLTVVRLEQNCQWPGVDGGVGIAQMDFGLAKIFWIHFVKTILIYFHLNSTKLFVYTNKYQMMINCMA